MESLASCIAAMLDMDSHMVTAAGMEVMATVAMVMFVVALRQEIFVEQKTSLEEEAEALCWRLVAMHSTTGVMLWMAKVEAAGWMDTEEESLAVVAGFARRYHQMVLAKLAVLESTAVD
jgi:hypothetical protein